MTISKKQFRTIDDYIKTLPNDVQRILEKMRQTIREAAPEAVEAISYQMPTLKLNAKNLVHFAAFKNHIPYDLVKKIVKYRVKENLEKIKGGK